MDIHCLPEGKRARLPNTIEGHEQVARLTIGVGALVGFEGCEAQKSIWWIDFPGGAGQEWRLWSTLDTAEIATRQLPPARIKAIAACPGTRANTDPIDAELIARFMMFRPQLSWPAVTTRS